MRKQFFTWWWLPIVALFIVCIAFSLYRNNKGKDSSTIAVKDNGTSVVEDNVSCHRLQELYVDYIKYTIKDGHLVVSGYDHAGFKGVAKIISNVTYKGSSYEVLEIAPYAFNGCDILTSLTIPSSVTSIGEYNQEIKGETNAVVIPVNC